MEETNYLKTRGSQLSVYESNLATDLNFVSIDQTPNKLLYHE